MRSVVAIMMMLANANSVICTQRKETACGETVVSVLWRVLESYGDICSFTVTTLSSSTWVSRCSTPSQK